MKIDRTVSTDKPLDVVFDYLSDFTNTEDWDPGTVTTRRVSGDGGVGTEYHNRSKFAGRTSDVTYVVDAYEPGRQFALTGRNKSLTVRDTMTFERVGQETRVRYVADFDFKGVVGLIAPLLAPALKRLGDEAEKGMHDALAAL